MSDDSFRTELRNTKVLEGPFPNCDFDTFPATPHDAFKQWFHEAVEAGVKEPHAMTLSTVDQEGCPDARVLILKNVDSRGWHFAIKIDSPKGKQVVSNGHAALTFYWPQMARQVRVKGKAVALPSDECALDYQARPLASRASAVASKQSQVLSNREDLARSVSEAESVMKTDPLVGMDKWCVFAVAPKSVEFWQGDASRLHNRLEYVWDGELGQWKKQLLWP